MLQCIIRQEWSVRCCCRRHRRRCWCTRTNRLCCYLFLHFISNRLISFFPVACPRVPPPVTLSCPSVFLDVFSSLFSLFSSPRRLSSSSSPSLFCPCLSLSLYRTPNVSSNGNPGYESLPLTDRQSPPPSVSSSVLVTPSRSVCHFITTVSHTPLALNQLAG